MSKTPDITNILFDENFKKFMCKEIITAQDPDSKYYISHQISYGFYHLALQIFFEKNNYNKKPSKTDNLAFLLLLTYPERMILEFKNFKDLKLSFNNFSEESDFNDECLIIDESSTRTCICNERIKYVHKFRNKYSSISFQIGSICNERYGLISKNDPNYKSNCQKIKEYQERQREIKEGLSIGYYEQLRNAEKVLKLQQKMERELNKKIKDQEKLMKREKKQQKEEEKLMAQEDEHIKQLMITNNYKKCIICRKEGLYNKYCKLTICNKCVNNKDKNKKNLINNEIFNKKREYKEDECLNCENKFIYRCKGILKHFCGNCEKKYKILKCSLCPNEYMDEINSTDIFCNICDEKSKNCIDCKHKFLLENTNLLRCKICEYRFINKIKIKICQGCYEEFEIKENENWKTYCCECFKDNLCSVKCPICGLTFKKLPNQEWKKTCTECYYKTKK